MTEKVTNLTSKDLLIEMCGHEHVYSYETVKAVSMKLGNEIADYLIRAVGGSVGGHKDRFDGMVDGLNWEFCLQHNTKNDGNNRLDLERAPGRCVQILGRPNPGWITAEQFLVMHGQEPEVLLEAIDVVRSRHGQYGQLRLKV